MFFYYSSELYDQNLFSTDYEKKITDNGKFTTGLSLKNTSQGVKSLNGNIGFKLNF